MSLGLIEVVVWLGVFVLFLFCFFYTLVTCAEVMVWIQIIILAIFPFLFCLIDSVDLSVCIWGS